MLLGTFKKKESTKFFSFFFLFSTTIKYNFKKDYCNDVLCGEVVDISLGANCSGSSKTVSPLASPSWMLDYLQNFYCLSRN